MSTILKLGSRGPEVRRLQELLNQKLKPSPRLKVDGDYGGKTDSAVRAFQKSHRLSVDGVVGDNTWKSLEANTGPAETQAVATVDPPWLVVARNEIGQSEIKGNQYHNPRILEYHATTTLGAKSDETAWCASFVNWCLKKSGVVGTNSAAAASWLNWGYEGTAIPGAIAVIYNKAAANSNLSTSGNHVGFLVEETSSAYSILGGNQSDSVKISSFGKAKWRLKGYRWPFKT